MNPSSASSIAVESARQIGVDVAALDVVLSREQLEEIASMFPLGAARGERYPENMMTALNR